MRGERHGIRETLVHLGRRGWKAGEDKDRKREKDEGQIVRSGFRMVRLGGGKGSTMGFRLPKTGSPHFSLAEKKKSTVRFYPQRAS